MILVTGGGGFVGVNAARCLADKGEEVMLLQRRSRGVPPCSSGILGQTGERGDGQHSRAPVPLRLDERIPHRRHCPRCL